jgi:hypothetical protein
MESEITTETTVILKLTGLEANWLKEIVQNPIGGIDPQNEHEFEKRIRKSFWDALNLVKP